MFVMTAKVQKKKLLLAAGAAVLVIVAIVLLLGGGASTPTASVNNITSNDDRVQFLASFGWEVVNSPTESSQVRIPSSESEVFTRYNALQKTMGYDLSEYAGKTVMRYVYRIKNYPGATEPVYATILVANHQVVGGDITDTAATGTMQGFSMQGNS